MLGALLNEEGDAALDVLDFGNDSFTSLADIMEAEEVTLAAADPMPRTLLSRRILFCLPCQAWVIAKVQKSGRIGRDIQVTTEFGDWKLDKDKFLSSVADAEGTAGADMACYWALAE